MARNSARALFSIQDLAIGFAIPTGDLHDPIEENSQLLQDLNIQNRSIGFVNSFVNMVNKVLPSPMDSLIYIVGITDGLTHLASLAIYYLLKDDMKLSPAAMSFILMFPAIPWFLKPALGFFSDAIPIFGYRRKPYLILFGIIQSLGYLMLAKNFTNIYSVGGALLLISFSSAICCTVCEALVVEKTRLDESDSVGSASLNVSKLIGAKAVGSLLVSYLSGSLLEVYTKKQIFVFTSIFPIFVTLCGILMTEMRTDTANHETYATLRENLSRLIEFLNKPEIYGPAIFILLFMSGPDYDDALFYYYTNRLHFSPTFMGSLRLTYGIAALLGIFVYQTFMATKSYKSVLLWTTVINLPIYASPWLLVTKLNRKMGISDEVFVLSGGFLIEAVAEVQLLPLLVFVSYICPENLEGTVYSIIISLRHLGTAISKITSSLGIWGFQITQEDYSNLSTFILVCASLTTVPLFFLNLIPTTEQMQKLKLENRQKVEKVTA